MKDEQIRRNAYRWALVVAGTAVMFVFLVSGAVGLIGYEEAEWPNIDRVYFAVPAVGIIGALIARFRPYGMSRALVATALAQVVATGVAVALRGDPVASLKPEMVLNGIFVSLFIVSAMLFRRAAAG